MSLKLYLKNKSPGVKESPTKTLSSMDDRTNLAPHTEVPFELFSENEKRFHPASTDSSISLFLWCFLKGGPRAALGSDNPAYGPDE